MARMSKYQSNCEPIDEMIFVHAVYYTMRVLSMRFSTLLQRGVIAVIIGVLLVSIGAPVALAGTGPSETESLTGHSKQPSDITINGLEIVFQDVRIVGNGLPEIDFEDRTYSIEERTITVKHMSVIVNGVEIGLDGFSITIEESTLSVRNISISSE